MVSHTLSEGCGSPVVNQLSNNKLFEMFRLILLLSLSSLLELTDCAVDLQCDEVCLHDVAQYTCTIDGTLLSWVLPDTTILQLLIQQPNVTDPTNTFTAVVTDFSNNQLTSTLSFMTTIQLNNEEIMCISGGTASCNIKISGNSITNH